MLFKNEELVWFIKATRSALYGDDLLCRKRPPDRLQPPYPGPLGIVG
jgi:hypothetical protein